MKKLIIVLQLLTFYCLWAKGQTLPPIDQATSDSTGKKVIPATKKNDDDKIFAKTEIEAAFPGGQISWKLFLKNNLRSSVAADNNAPAGTYTVQVRFIVSKNGVVSDIVAETNLGFGMEDEAIRVIKKGPKWTPALQNGSNVAAYTRRSITFDVY